MKKTVSILFAFMLLMSVKVFSQGWVYKGIFPPAPDTLRTNTGVQFVTVDPDGKIWIAPYRTSDSLFVPDSGKKFSVRPVYVYNPDGTPWDTIKAVTVGGVLHPLYNSKYGITRDNNGNILVNDYSDLYRINYKTGQGMNYVSPGISALCNPAVDSSGNIYLAPVLPGHPIEIYNSDFSFNSNAVDVIDTAATYGRWMAVSPDGNTLYVARYTDGFLRVYHRPDAFSSYALVDTVLRGIACESGTWDPVNGNLWLSTGNYSYNQPTGQFAGTEGTWYSFNTKTWAIEDSIKWSFFSPQDPNERPRGIAFSNDGKDVYLACFGNSTYPPVEWFHNDSHVTGISVEKRSNVVSGYQLSQNYPNPFNPSTEITFSVPKSGLVTLKIYDLLGRLVSTLVNENKSTGNYTVRFDASRLASGTYIYQMNANGVLLTKKMVLLK
ncbi:MAG: T9SS type A sorting domain-containing protein [Candidatus Aquicultor sp.]